MKKWIPLTLFLTAISSSFASYTPRYSWRCISAFSGKPETYYCCGSTKTVYNYRNGTSKTIPSAQVTGITPCTSAIQPTPSQCESALNGTALSTSKTILGQAYDCTLHDAQS